MTSELFQDFMQRQ